MNKTNYNYGAIDMTQPNNNVISQDKNWKQLTEQLPAAFNERIDIALLYNAEYLIQVDLDPVLSNGSTQILITPHMINLSDDGAIGWGCGNLNNYAGGGVFITSGDNVMYFVFNSEQHLENQNVLSKVYFRVFYR